MNVALHEMLPYVAAAGHNQFIYIISVYLYLANAIPTSWSP